MIRKTTILRTVLAAGCAVAIAAGSAHAIPDSPRGARKFFAEFVKHYAPCDPLAVNDATLNPFLPRPACQPPVMGAAACQFAPNGKGKLKMRANIGAGDIDYQVKFRGLEPACAGLQMDYALRYRQTNDDCSIGAGDCTAVDGDVIAGSCIVTPSGACTINSSINVDAGGTVFQPGFETSLEIHGCAMMIGGEVAFTCGMFLD